MRDWKKILLTVGLAYLTVAFTPAVLLREALQAGLHLTPHALVV